jgi:hypothetical protein
MTSSERRVSGRGAGMGPRRFATRPPRAPSGWVATLFWVRLTVASPTCPRCLAGREDGSAGCCSRSAGAHAVGRTASTQTVEHYVCHYSAKRTTSVWTKTGRGPSSVWIRTRFRGAASSSIRLTVTVRPANSKRCPGRRRLTSITRASGSKGRCPTSAGARARHREGVSSPTRS